MNLKRIKLELEIQVVSISQDPNRQKQLVESALAIFELEKDNSRDPGHINAKLRELIKTIRLPERAND